MKYFVFILGILGAFIVTPLIIREFIYIINFEFTDLELNRPNLYAGILSGIFTALAFIGVLITLYLQKQQTQNSESTYKIQRFETTFFNMLQLQQQIIESLSVSHSYYTEADEENTPQKVTEIIHGRAVFEHLFNNGKWTLANKDDINKIFNEQLPNSSIGSYFSMVNKTGESIKTTSNSGMKKIIVYFGIRGYEEASELSLFDHYFRHLYQIMKLIDNSSLLETSNDVIKERYKYTSILRATLSPYELIWLFYNCISLYGNQKFKPLIEKYSLLKNIREDLLETSMECLKYRSDQCIIDKNDYPQNDYDFYSSSEKGQKNKYFLSAFYNKEDLTEAIQRKIEQESFRQRQTNN